MRGMVRAAGVLACAALAGAETWTFPLPSAPDLSVFGREILLLYAGPPIGSTILMTRLRATFETDDSFAAADLILQLSPLTPEPPWILEGGADLGWGADPGVYSAVLETDQYNGPVTSEFWESLIDATGNLFLGGHFLDDSAFEVDYLPIPEPGSAAGMAVAFILLRRRR